MDWTSFGLNALSVALSVAGLGVPAVLAGAATYFIKNKAVADVVGQAAGVAYTHMAESFSQDHTIGFAAAKDAAVAAGVSAVQTSLNKAVPNNAEAVAKVTGALGQLLAGDVNFHVTTPTPTLAVALQPVALQPVAGEQTAPPSWFVPVPSPAERQDTATQGGGG